ncbi:MAG: hypothetical protein NXH79_05135, partial [Rhodobacteraceae bacterium]|nr:hypothetical protein [Paracoccaceae bacterium]
KGRPRRPGMGCRPQSAGHNIRRALRRLNVSENRMGPLRYTEDQTLPEPTQLQPNRLIRLLLCHLSAIDPRKCLIQDSFTLLIPKSFSDSK